MNSLNRTSKSLLRSRLVVGVGLNPIDNQTQFCIFPVDFALTLCSMFFLSIFSIVFHFIDCSIGVRTRGEGDALKIWASTRRFARANVK